MTIQNVYSGINISELTHNASKDISHSLSTVSYIGIFAWVHSVCSRQSIFMNLTDIAVHSCSCSFSKE